MVNEQIEISELNLNICRYILGTIMVMMKESWEVIKINVISEFVLVQGYSVGVSVVVSVRT